MTADGDAHIQLEVKFDFDRNTTHQPDPYLLEQISLPAIFGDLDTSFGQIGLRFGAAGNAGGSAHTEGSGKVIAIRVRSQDIIDDAPFDIQSFSIDLTGGGKI